MNSIQKLKNNFFKVYSEWANGQYELSKHGDGYKVELSFEQLSLQPANSVMIIGNQIVHRLYIPTEDTVLSYDVIIKKSDDNDVIFFGNFDMYITVIDGNLTESMTNTKLKSNLVYIIPAGQYYCFKTEQQCRYFMSLKLKENFKENNKPTKLETFNN